MATRCSKHAYVNDGVVCPYCELDRLRAELKLANETASNNAMWCQKYEQENSELKRALDYLADGHVRLSSLVRNNLTRQDFIDEAMQYSREQLRNEGKGK